MSRLLSLLPLFIIPMSSFFIIVSLYYIYRGLRSLIRGWFNWQPIWIKDVSRETIPLPQGVLDAENYVQALGFAPIGVVYVCLRSYPKPEYQWDYGTADGSIYAEVVQHPDAPFFLTQFATCFADSSMIITRYPIGSNVRNSNFQSRFGTQSIEVTYEYHQRQVAAWKNEHGRPLVCQSLEDIQRCDDLYRKSYRRIDQWWLTRYNLVFTGAFLLIGIASVVSVLFALIPDFRHVVLSLTLLSGAGFLLYAAGTVIPRRFRHPPEAIDMPTKPN